MIINKTPHISIVTVVYNGENYLEETIKSVIYQSYNNFEYIIIDGGSNDNTLGIIKKYEKYINYWISEKDEGIYDAMNKGVKVAKGEWINFMNCGDCFMSKNILLELFTKNNVSDNLVIFGNAKIVYPSLNSRIIKSGNVRNLWKGSQFRHQSSFTNTLYLKERLFDIEYKIAADFKLFFDAWNQGGKFIKVCLNISACRSGGISDSNRIQTILEFWSIVDKTLFVNIYYVKVLFIEIIKNQIKKVLTIFFKFFQNLKYF
jgi:glycosyltransferase involved in cell wall biosynthesis